MCGAWYRNTDERYVQVGVRAGDVGLLPQVRYLLLFARVNLGVRDFQRAEELTMRAFQIFSKHPADDAVSRSMLHDCTEVMEEVLVAQKKAKEEKRRTNERANVLATLESGWGDPVREGVVRIVRV